MLPLVLAAVWASDVTTVGYSWRAVLREDRPWEGSYIRVVVPDGTYLGKVKVEVGEQCYEPYGEVVMGVRVGGLASLPVGLWDEIVVLNTSVYGMEFERPWGDVYLNFAQKARSQKTCAVAVISTMYFNPPKRITGQFTTTLQREDSLLYTPTKIGSIPTFTSDTTDGLLVVGAKQCSGPCKIQLSIPATPDGVTIFGSGDISCVEEDTQNDVIIAEKIMSYPPWDMTNRAGFVVGNVTSYVYVYVPPSQVGCRWYLTLENNGHTEVTGVFFDTQTSIPPYETMTIPVDYPLQGWHSISLETQDFSNIAITFADTASERCPGGCRGRGRCETIPGSSMYFTSCNCNRPFKGWGCGEYIDGARFPARFWFLVLSNVSFFPSIFMGVHLKAYTEAFVYACNMLASVMYHICDEDVAELCLWSYDDMQFLDFFTSFVSLWFTIMYLARVSDPMKSVVNACGAVSLAAAATINRQSPGSVAIPFCIVGTVAFSHWGWHCYLANGQKFDNGKALKHLWTTPWFHWRYFIPGATLAVAAFITDTALQTDDNYATTHSIWHLLIGSCPTLLLLAPLQPTYTVYLDTEYTSLLNVD